MEQANIRPVSEDTLFGGESEIITSSAPSIPAAQRSAARPATNYVNPKVRLAQEFLPATVTTITQNNIDMGPPLWGTYPMYAQQLQVAEYVKSIASVYPLENTPIPASQIMIDVNAGYGAFVLAALERKSFKLIFALERGNQYGRLVDNLRAAGAVQVAVAPPNSRPNYVQFKMGDTIVVCIEVDPYVAISQVVAPVATAVNVPTLAPARRVGMSAIPPPSQSSSSSIPPPQSSLSIPPPSQSSSIPPPSQSSSSSIPPPRSTIPPPQSSIPLASVSSSSLTTQPLTPLPEWAKIPYINYFKVSGVAVHHDLYVRPFSDKIVFPEEQIPDAVTAAVYQNLSIAIRSAKPLIYVYRYKTDDPIYGHVIPGSIFSYDEVSRVITTEYKPLGTIRLNNNFMAEYLRSNDHVATNRDQEISQIVATTVAQPLNSGATVYPSPVVADVNTWIEQHRAQLMKILEEAFTPEYTAKIIENPKCLYILAMAFTQETVDPGRSYDNLAILGDRVIDTLFTGYLLSAYPDITSNQITVLKSNYVDKRYLSKLSAGLDLGPLVRSQTADTSADVLEDVFESLFGAIMLCGDLIMGFKMAGTFPCQNLFAKFFNADTIDIALADTDFFTQLKELLERMGWDTKVKLLGKDAPFSLAVPEIVQQYIGAGMVGPINEELQSDAKRKLASQVVQRLAAVGITREYSRLIKFKRDLIGAIEGRIVKNFTPDPAKIATEDELFLQMSPQTQEIYQSAERYRVTNNFDYLEFHEPHKTRNKNTAVIQLRGVRQGRPSLIKSLTVKTSDEYTARRQLLIALNIA